MLIVRTYVLEGNTIFEIQVSTCFLFDVFLPSNFCAQGMTKLFAVLDYLIWVPLIQFEFGVTVLFVKVNRTVLVLINFQRYLYIQVALFIHPGGALIDYSLQLCCGFNCRLSCDRQCNIIRGGDYFALEYFHIS